jgi:hypothetical protein
VRRVGGALLIACAVIALGAAGLATAGIGVSGDNAGSVTVARR